ncbi:hypothetical protein DRQ53_00740 [bacterium]|nr:MAG: hypothetical protein DRQ53_00740 [bacterium]
MASPLRYADLEGSDPQALASVEEFLLRCLLGAREEAGIASNSSGFDEDVNVYVIGLLGRFLSSEFHDAARRYSFPTDMDLAREVQAQGDDRFGYLAYRTNADQLLIGIGLFCHVEGHGVSNDPVFGRSAGDLSGRGSTYYNLASSSLRRLRRRATAPELVMTKLADRFGEYTGILTRLRTSYFRLTGRLSEGELYHLGRDESPDPGQYWDAFLDAWSQYKRSSEADDLARLHEAADALRQVDPSFSFELPQS